MENSRQLNCYVKVTGEASDAKDKDIKGFYFVEVYLDRQVALDQFTLSEQSEIAAAALNAFHEKQGISTLDDFSIKVLLPDGSEVTEGEDVPASGLILRAIHVGQVNDSDLPFEVHKDGDLSVDEDLEDLEDLEYRTKVEYGVNEVMSGGGPHNPFDSNFETQEQAEQAGREYLIENPEVLEIVVFRLTILDNTITSDKTLLTIDRSDINNDLVAEVPRI